jgi:glutaredoxin 3
MAKVEIYTTHICGFCQRAKQLLSQKGAKFMDINIMVNAGKREEMIKRSNGGTTVPQIFIGDKHIGGCDDLFDLEYDGALDKLLS